MDGPGAYRCQHCDMVGLDLAAARDLRMCRPKVSAATCRDVAFDERPMQARRRANRLEATAIGQKVAKIGGQTRKRRPAAIENSVSSTAASVRTASDVCSVQSRPAPALGWREPHFEDAGEGQRRGVPVASVCGGRGRRGRRGASVDGVRFQGFTPFVPQGCANGVARDGKGHHPGRWRRR